MEPKGRVDCTWAAVRPVLQMRTSANIVLPSPLSALPMRLKVRATLGGLEEDVPEATSCPLMYIWAERSGFRTAATCDQVLSGRGFGASKLSGQLTFRDMTVKLGLPDESPEVKRTSELDPFPPSAATSTIRPQFATERGYTQPSSVMAEPMAGNVGAAKYDDPTTSATATSSAGPGSGEAGPAVW